MMEDGFKIRRRSSWATEDRFKISLDRGECGPKAHPKGRRCKKCNAPLSIYNGAQKCRPCQGR